MYFTCTWLLTSWNYTHESALHYFSQKTYEPRLSIIIQTYTKHVSNFSEVARKCHLSTHDRTIPGELFSYQCLFLYILSLVYPLFRISQIKKARCKALRDLIVLKKIYAVLIALKSFSCENLIVLACVGSKIKKSPFWIERSGGESDFSSLPSLCFVLLVRSVMLKYSYRETMSMRDFSSNSAQTDVSFLFRLSHYKRL